MPKKPEGWGFGLSEVGEKPIVSLFGVELVALRHGDDMYLGTRMYDPDRDESSEPWEFRHEEHHHVFTTSDEEARYFAHRILELLGDEEEGGYVRDALAAM